MFQMGGVSIAFRLVPVFAEQYNNKQLNQGSIPSQSPFGSFRSSPGNCDREWYGEGDSLNRLSARSGLRRQMIEQYKQAAFPGLNRLSARSGLRRKV